MGKNTLMVHYGCGVMHTKDNIFKIIVPPSNFNSAGLYKYIKALKLILCAAKQNVTYVPGDWDIITVGTVTINLLILVEIKANPWHFFSLYLFIYLVLYLFNFTVIISTLLEKKLSVEHIFHLHFLREVS